VRPAADRVGGKTMGEIEEDGQAFHDQQPLTVRCAFCQWTVTAPGASARAEAAAHRVAAHPAAGKPRGKPRAVSMAESRARGAATARTVRWTRERIVESLQAFAAEHGRPPSCLDARHHVGRLPQQPTCARAFGSWANAIEAAGFPRPTRSTRYP
jgi:hypothetical protein